MSVWTVRPTYRGVAGGTVHPRPSPSESATDFPSALGSELDRVSEELRRAHYDTIEDLEDLFTSFLGEAEHEGGLGIPLEAYLKRFEARRAVSG